MTESDELLIVQGLTSLQLAELKTAVSHIDDPTVSELENPPLPNGAHGEPITITVAITVTPIVIAAIAMWLAKQKSRRVEKLRIWTKTPNGAEKLIEFDRSAYDEGESAAPTIESFIKEALNAGSK